MSEIILLTQVVKKEFFYSLRPEKDIFFTFFTSTKAPFVNTKRKYLTWASRHSHPCKYFQRRVWRRSLRALPDFPRPDDDERIHYDPASNPFLFIAI